MIGPAVGNDGSARPCPQRSARQCPVVCEVADPVPFSGIQIRQTEPLSRDASIRRMAILQLYVLRRCCRA